MNKKIYKLTSGLQKIPFKILPKLTGQKLILPFYHTVSDDIPIHVKHLYNIKTVKQFENDLDFLLKYYEPIDYKILLDNLKNGKLKTNQFLLTFDDGLREFYDIIAPILLKKGVPAICFLNSGFINNKDLFYRFKASLLIDKLRNTKFLSEDKIKINQWFEKNDLETNNFSSLLSINYKNRKLFDELSFLTGLNFSKYLIKNKPYLTTVQINELIKKGFHFGAHSIDHPLYTDIDEVEQIIQTKESINFIKTSFKLNYKLFSFPFSDVNVSKYFFDTIFNKDNPVADLTFGTAGIKKDLIKFNLERIPMEIDNFTAKDIISGEYIYYLFKTILNKNTIKRR